MKAPGWLETIDRAAKAVAEKTVDHRGLDSCTLRDPARGDGRRPLLLQLSDLRGRVLTIERSLSAGVLGRPKSERTRRVTLGTGTADMIRRHFQV